MTPLYHRRYPLPRHGMIPRVNGQGQQADLHSSRKGGKAVRPDGRPRETNPDRAGNLLSCPATPTPSHHRRGRPGNGGFRTPPTIGTKTVWMDIPKDVAMDVPKDGPMDVAINGPMNVAMNGPMDVAMNGPMDVAINGPMNVAINGPMNVAINGPMNVAMEGKRIPQVPPPSNPTLIRIPQDTRWRHHRSHKRLPSLHPPIPGEPGCKGKWNIHNAPHLNPGLPNNPLYTGLNRGHPSSRNQPAHSLHFVSLWAPSPGTVFPAPMIMYHSSRVCRMMPHPSPFHKQRSSRSMTGTVT